MPPADIAPSNNITGFVLNHHHDHHNNATFADAAATASNYQTVAARAMIAQRQRKQDDTDDKTLALLRAQHLVALKQQELDMAMIRRLREEEQFRKELLSNNHNREATLMNINGALMTMAGSVSVEDGSSRLNGSSRKRRLEDDILLEERENVFMRSKQRQEEELILLNNLRKEEMLAVSRGNQEAALPLNSIMGQQNMLSSMSTSSQELLSLYNYYNTTYGSGLNGSNNIYAAMPTSTAPLATSSIIGAAMDVLRDSASAASSHFVRPSSRQQETREHEGQYDHILATAKRIKKTVGNRAVNNGDGFEQQHHHQSGQQSQQAQQQQRFNKHQCKQWTVKYQELLAFKAKEGHCNVPHGYKKNTGLAMWVKRQRRQFNIIVDNQLSTLTGERIRLLNDIGFVWSCFDSAWEQHFEELRHFAICNGHCVVPSTYIENPKLASWAITQRRQCKLLGDGKPSSMTLKRLAALQRIGFSVTTRKKRKY